MEILVLLKPEEFAAINWSEVAGNRHPDLVLVNRDVLEGEEPSKSSALLVRARGIDESVLALVRRRSEVAEVRSTEGALLIELHGDADSAPLVSLLVESGVEIVEVHRREKRLEELLNQIAFAAN